MHGFIAYSRPRGIYGRFTLTVSLSFVPGEQSRIEMTRPGATNAYRCGSCGRWATIAINTINPTEHRKSGTMEFYRFDNVEPGDFMDLVLSDPELLWHQTTRVIIDNTGITANNIDHNMHQTRPNNALPRPDKHFYDIFVINWDQYCQERRTSQRDTTVEEELIQHVMNAEPITIKQLQLGSPKQPTSIQMPFVEGTLTYLEEKPNG